MLIIVDFGTIVSLFATVYYFIQWKRHDEMYYGEVKNSWLVIFLIIQALRIAIWLNG